MDYKIKDLDHKMKSIKTSLDYKERMTRFEYKFADSLFKSIKYSIDLEDDSNFKQCFYNNGIVCENTFYYNTTLIFNFYKDNVSQILSSRFKSNLVRNEVNEMLIDNNINLYDLYYSYNEGMLEDLHKNEKVFIDTKEDRTVSIEVQCALQFNYLSFPELLSHRILKSSFVRFLCGSLERKNKNDSYI